MISIRWWPLRALLAFLIWAWLIILPLAGPVLFLMIAPYISGRWSGTRMRIWQALLMGLVEGLIVIGAVAAVLMYAGGIYIALLEIVLLIAVPVVAILFFMLGAISGGWLSIRRV